MSYLEEDTIMQRDLERERERVALHVRNNIVREAHRHDSD